MDTKDVNKSVQDEQFGGEDTFPENNENSQEKSLPNSSEDKTSEVKDEVVDKEVVVPEGKVEDVSLKENEMEEESKDVDEKPEKEIEKPQETSVEAKTEEEMMEETVKEAVPLKENEENSVEIIDPQGKETSVEAKTEEVVEEETAKEAIASKEKEENPVEIIDSQDGKMIVEEKTEGVGIEEIGEKVVALKAKEVKQEKELSKEEGANDVVDKTVEEEIAKEEKGIPESNTSSEENNADPEVDYATLSKDDLVKGLSELIDSKSIQIVQKYVDVIKINFYKKHKADTEAKKKVFLEEGGTIEDFKLAPDPKELELKELLKKFRNIKASHNRDLEGEKDKNLKDKYQVIEEIKELINGKESINETFHIFRELQKRWRNIGIVPQQKIKDLWETYHHHVEKFYDYIKINKELRDIDLKKNQELKIQLSEKAEELLLEPSIVSAFKQLQKFHEQWREIGPVPNELKANIWERFKEATSKINKKHQEYFQELKKAEQKNLEAKTHLCEQVEELCSLEIESLREWNKKSKEVVEIQKMWRTIGFAPKKYNNKIYTRFREACDNFFSKKRSFFAEHKQEEDKNLQLKIELCIQAEGLKESNEWKKTTEELIELQKKWKEIGPVARKDSDTVWKRFRASCDHFFNSKAKHFSQVDTQYEDNLKMKSDLIKEIEEFKGTEDLDENFIMLKGFQKRWTEIGFVPFKFKDEIQNQYRAAINKQFDELQIDDKRRSSLKFRNKLDSIKQKPKSDFRIEREREKFVNKLKKLESNLVLWENNIGFFASSKNADSMINSFKLKIEQTRKDMEILKNKIRMIDEMDDQ